jgi:hypothetical protein
MIKCFTKRSCNLQGDDQVLHEMLLQFAGDDQVLHETFLQFAGEKKRFSALFRNGEKDDTALIAFRIRSFRRIDYTPP